ncbi:MAG: class I SAM-dependent methyltransferase, partial [Pseudomonas sp.]
MAQKVLYRREEPESLVQPTPSYDDFARVTVENLLQRADISVNGSRPWDLQVHDPRLYERILGQGTLGLGEAYLDGWWDCPKLDEFAYRALLANVDEQIPMSLHEGWLLLRGFLANLQSRARAFVVGERHYDLGNALYECMLDRRMTYTCGYWQDAADLEQAQERKLDLVCRKLALQPGDRVLDIGCGWGSFAELAALRFGAFVVGITFCREQAQIAQLRCLG